MMATVWRGPENMFAVLRRGQVVATEAPAPRAGWPQETAEATRLRAAPCAAQATLPCRCTAGSRGGSLASSRAQGSTLATASCGLFMIMLEATVRHGSR
jgi:hypothetical protein